MRVNPNSEPLNTNPLSTARTPSQIGIREAGLGADQPSFETAETLNRALEQIPATRAAQVTQAKSLLTDTTYPPPELIRRISALIAPHLRFSEASK